MKWCIVIASLAFGCRSDTEHRPPPSKPEAEPVPEEPANANVEHDVSIVHATVLQDGAEPSDVAMPIGPHRSGEQVRDAWIAPDGTQFLLGYMYTGVPGPDTGVVYRRRKGERAFEIFYSILEHELGHIAGVSATDFYVGGANVLRHYDGKTWQDLALPPTVKDISALALHDNTLWLASFDQETLFHRALDATTWEAEDVPKWPYNKIAFAGDHVFAGGVEKVIHRFPDGHWASEVDIPHHGIRSFYVASPKDIYIAGREATLMHTSGDGKWSAIPAGNGIEGYTVWGRSPTEIYVDSGDGVYVWRGAKAGYSRTPLRSGRFLVGDATTLLVAYEVDHTDRPPP